VLQEEECVLLGSDTVLKIKSSPGEIGIKWLTLLDQGQEKGTGTGKGDRLLS
jgi:hypothetical protein